MEEANSPLLTPQELEATGLALYGADWRGRLAEALGVTKRQLTQVESGKAATPAEWRPRLIALAQDTALRAMEAASELLWRHGEGRGERDEEPRAELRLV
jgi:hypothetical protein